MLLLLLAHFPAYTHTISWHRNNHWFVRNFLLTLDTMDLDSPTTTPALNHSGWSSDSESSTRLFGSTESILHTNTGKALRVKCCSIFFSKFSVIDIVCDDGSNTYPFCAVKTIVLLGKIIIICFFFCL